MRKSVLCLCGCGTKIVSSDSRGRERKFVRGKSGHVHHIDYNKKNDDRENLILLCKFCHGQTIPAESREYWRKRLSGVRRRRGTGFVA